MTCYTTIFTVLAVVASLVFVLKKIIDGKEKDVKGKVVLITGGASGIGLLMAKKFAALGSKIVLWDINKEMLDKIEKEFKAQGTQIHTYVCDVSDKKNIYKTAEQVLKDVDHVEILINNAGIVVGKNFLDTTDEQTEKVMNVNTMAPMWIVKAFLPEMLKSKSGHLVTIASAAGTIGCPKLVDYCASKFAAIGFLEALRFELQHNKQHFIKTTTVMPFFINTGMFSGVRSPFVPILEPDEVVNQIVRYIRLEKANLYTPAFIKSSFLLRFAPSSVMEWGGKFLGITRSMDEFKGRSIANK